ncbi:MAG: hypothetical protein K9J13_09470 [Saprospiraceae bacterium]|nr:hypothetical protein [Saprospiraceae bacterium]
MIRYLTSQEIDFDKWNNCISNSINGLVYAYSWYLDIVCDSWDALVEDDYVSVFPLTFNSKANIHYLFQPVFTQQLGVFSTQGITTEKTNRFFNAIPSRFKLIEINLNKLNEMDLPQLKKEKWLTHELELINSYENIFKNYSSNVKRNIKKAQEQKVNISKNLKPEDVISLFRNNKGKNIKSLKDADYERLRRLIYKCIYNDKVSIYGAYSAKNELCAGAFFVESNKRAIFLFSGTSDEARENGAMSFLIDSYIKENSQKEITLDFEGSNDENLARFYKSFGAKEYYYLHIYLNRLPFLQKIVVRAFKGVRRNI